MVLIRLKSQYVSLIVTVLSGVAELCLLGAALAFNRFAECHALKHGRQVSVRHHRVRTKLLAVLAMLVFIALEVVSSFFTNPELSPETETRPCVAIDRFDVRSGAIGDVEADAILITCARADGDRVFQHAGNRSRPGNGPEEPDPEVLCAELPLYMFIEESIMTMPISANQTRACAGDICAYAELRDHELRYSVGLNPDEVDDLIAEQVQISYLVTTLLFDVDRNQQSVLAQRVANTYNATVTDPIEQRRRVLTASDRTVCPFLLSKEPNATEVPTALLVVIVTSWALSVLVFASSLLLRPKLFFDMSDPMHWALRTNRHAEESVAENPVVTSVYEHGERLMYVSSSSSAEYRFLRRATSLLRERFKSLRRPVPDASVEELSGAVGATVVDTERQLA